MEFKKPCLLKTHNAREINFAMFIKTSNIVGSHP